MRAGFKCSSGFVQQNDRMPRGRVPQTKITKQDLFFSRREVVYVVRGTIIQFHRKTQITIFCRYWP